MFDLASEHNFPVEMQPIFDRDGNMIEGSRCVMRTDTNTVLGVHGSRYHIVKHDDVVNSILDGVSAANLSTDYKVDVHVIDEGRKLRGEILFNDLVVEPNVGDYVKFRISFFNSYDASWSFSQAADGLRLWCLNGCTTADHVAVSRFKHTQSLSVEGSASKMINGLQHFMSQPETWREWQRIQITDEFADNFFRHTVAKSPSRQINANKANEKQLEKLLGIWGNESAQLGHNKWALYNCLTYWASHTEDLKNPQVARRMREEAIASSMKHKLWLEA